ncbi:glycosyltransferase [Lunatimonas salinarum]|uniref:glycosyltransferase n=1 Tax=Lunatimonas salinarum TaxID=1774590 RepID=UPI001ADFE949|nr:glycosyltransferase [Lunatimonas salinarum]
MIIFYLPNLRPGGAERVMITLANEYHAQGIDILFVVNNNEGPFIHILNKNIKIISFNTKSKFLCLFRLINLCKRIRPNVIIATLGASVTSSLINIFLPKKIKIINRLGNTVGEEIKSLGTLSQFKYKTAINLIAFLSDKIIFQSNLMKEDFFKNVITQPKTIKIIYNPIDHQLINLKAKEKCEKYTFIAVGRLAVQKDYKTMILAINEVAKFDQNITLGIIGQGILEQQLKEIVKELNLQKNIKFLGYRSNPYCYIRQAKFLLSTSIYEGFPNVVIESLLLNTPVILSDCPSGIKEFFRNNYHGLFAQTGNYKSFSDKIISAIKDYNKFEKFDYSKEIVDQFDVKKITEEYKIFAR